MNTSIFTKITEFKQKNKTDSVKKTKSVYCLTI